MQSGLGRVFDGLSEAADDADGLCWDRVKGAENRPDHEEDDDDVTDDGESDL